MADKTPGADILAQFAAFMEAKSKADAESDDFAVDLETTVDGKTVKLAGVPFSKIGADVRKALGLTGDKPAEGGGDGGSESGDGGDGKQPPQLKDYFRGGKKAAGGKS